MGKNTIDINCDMGEGAGNDHLIMPFISSANIACGFHAGDPETMWETMKLALQHDVSIGAHVSFLDRENFGRTEMMIDADDVYEIVTQQLIILQEIANGHTTTLKHVKPHGALYNMSARDSKLATTIARAVFDFDRSLILFGLSGSHSIREATEIGLRVANEAFADRSYQQDGSLTPRTKADALLESEPQVLKQVLQMIQREKVSSQGGGEIAIVADTICIHGDGAHAATFAKAIHQHLKLHHIDIKAL